MSEHENELDAIERELRRAFPRPAQPALPRGVVRVQPQDVDVYLVEDGAEWYAVTHIRGDTSVWRCSCGHQDCEHIVKARGH